MGNDRAAAARSRRSRAQPPRGRLTALCLAAWTVAAAAAPGPARIVSLNLCTDTMLFELVGASRIASVTWLSRDPNLSPWHAEAAEIPSNRGSAEELVALAPDLVVTDASTLPFTRRVMERLGARVLTFPHANDFATYRENLTRLAAETGTEARARQLLAPFEHDPPAPMDGPRTLVYQPNGFTAGSGTLMHAVLARAGLRNLGADLPGRFGGFVPLESLLTMTPAVVVFSQRSAAAPSLAEAQLAHPALSRFLDGQASSRPRSISVPERLWTCAGTHNLEAVALLRAATR